MIEQANKVDVVVTGLGWVGAGVRSIDGVLREMVRSARSSLDITVYSLTDGAAIVFEEIEAALGIGVKVRLVVNDLGDQRNAARNRLRTLLDRFPGQFHVWNFPRQPDAEKAGLHAKVIVVDRRKALVGSANLSFLGLAGSHELGVSVDGPAAERVALCVDQLLGTRFVTPCVTSKDIPE